MRPPLPHQDSLGIGCLLFAFRPIAPSFFQLHPGFRVERGICFGEMDFVPLVAFGDVRKKWQHIGGQDTGQGSICVLCCSIRGTVGLHLFLGVGVGELVSVPFPSMSTPEAHWTSSGICYPGDCPGTMFGAKLGTDLGQTWGLWCWDRVWHWWAGPGAFGRGGGVGGPSGVLGGLSHSPFSLARALGNEQCSNNELCMIWAPCGSTAARTWPMWGHPSSLCCIPCPDSLVPFH